MNRIRGLDGIRAVSVGMVIFSHAVIWPRIGVTSPGMMEIFSPNLGVSIFFLLSGFLITLLLIRERQVAGKTDLAGFFMRRVLRIFPLYFVAIFLVATMDYFGYANVENCLYSYAFTYTINYAPKSCHYLSLSHLWSLAVEEHFYLIWPIIFLFSRKAAIVFATVFAWACLYFGTDYFTSNETHFTYRWSFPAAVPIAFGCLVAFICDKPWVKRTFSDPRTSGILLFAIIAGMASPGFYNVKLVWLLSLSSLMLYVYHNQDSALVRILELKPLVVIGVISYGLYVWHGVLSGNGPYRANSLPFPPEMDVGLWMSFVIAPLSYVFFERPMLRLKSRFSWREPRILTRRPQLES